MLQIVIGILIGLVILLVGFFIGVMYRKKVAEGKIGSAEIEAFKIVAEAEKEAEAKKKEALVEAKEEILKTKKPGYDWAFESSSGAANLVSHMTYVANNNEYVEGVPADERELYFVCNNGTQPHEDGAITVNFDRTVSGSYIFGGVEKTFTGKTLTVDTKAGEGFAILLNK